MQAFYQNLLTDVRPDGVHREHSTHYHMMVLRSYLGARENVRRFGLSFPPDYDERLERACEFAMHCHRPDGGIPTLSDSDAGNYSDLLRLASSLFHAPTSFMRLLPALRGCRRKSSTSVFRMPAITSSEVAGGGEIPFEQEGFLIFDCGPLGEAVMDTTTC